MFSKSVIQPQPCTGTSPPPLESHCAWVYNGCLYVFGGYDGSKVVDHMYKLIIDSFHWSKLQLAELSGSLPSARAGHRCVLADTDLFVFGGADALARFDDLYHLKMPTMTWKKLRASGSTPEARYYHSFVSIPNKPTQVLLFGGNSGKTILDDLWTLDTVAKVWHQPKTHGSIAPPLYAHNAVFVNDKILMISGGLTKRSVETREIHLLNVTTWAWTTLALRNEVFPRVAHHTTLDFACFIFVYGGSTDSKGTLNSVLKLDLDNQVCTNVPVPVPAKGRQRHSMTHLSGSRVAVFGGWDGEKVCSDLILLDCSAFVTTTATNDAPTTTTATKFLDFDLGVSLTGNSTQPSSSANNSQSQQTTQHNANSVGREPSTIEDSAWGVTSMLKRALTPRTAPQSTVNTPHVLAAQSRPHTQRYSSPPSSVPHEELVMARGEIAKLIVTVEMMKREMQSMQQRISTLEEANKKLKQKD